MSDEPIVPGPDALERLAAYSPTRATLAAEWDADDRADLRARLLADAAATRPSRFRRRPDRRPRRAGQRYALTPLLAAAAIVALIIGVVTFAARHDANRPPQQPGGPAYTAPSIRDTPEVGPGQYAYTYSTSYVISPDGSRDDRTVATDEEWVATDGDTWSYRVSGKKTDCYHFPFRRSQEPDGFGSADKASYDALPTDPAALASYLRTHATGSSSKEEAVFVAVGDLLRTADGFASSRLRAAMVSVLSRTGGVTIHRDVRDPGRRPAVRADFVDEARQPGRISSLYFAPGTYQLLASRGGFTGHPDRRIGPSVAYSVAPANDRTPVELTGRAVVDVVTVEKVVDRLPAKAAGCKIGS